MTAIRSLSAKGEMSGMGAVGRCGWESLLSPRRRAMSTFPGGAVGSSWGWRREMGYKPRMIVDPLSWHLALVFGVCLAASLALTGLLRRWLLSRQILDRPNERSAHTTPVPRGGGLAILTVLLPAWAFIQPALWPLLLAAAALGA